MSERCGCGVENTGTARFCRECGRPLAALAFPPPVAPEAIRRCAKCAAENALTSKFCTSCGATLHRLELAGSIDAATEQRGRPLARKMAIALAAVFAFALLAQGTSYWYRINREHAAALAETARLQEQARRNAELQRLALAEAARRPLAQSGREEISPPERVIEHPTAAARRPVPAVAPTRAVLKRAPPLRGVVAKRERRARQDDSVLAGREPARPVEAASVAAVDPPRIVPAAPMAVIADSPQSLCQSKSNFLSRAICDALECGKAQFAQSRYCQAVREQGARSISHSQ
jgi:hypothetical protein